MREMGRDPVPAYERVRLFFGGGAELVFLRWADRVASAVHDHGGGRGWVFLCRGSVIERTYEARDGVPSEAGHRKHRAPSIFRVRQDTLHTMESIGSTEARTLHAFFGVVDRMRVFDPARGAFVSVVDGAGATLPVDERSVVEPAT